MKISFFAGIFVVTIFLTTGSNWANTEICGATGEKAAELESKGDLTTALWCYTNHKNWQAAVAPQKEVIPSSLARIGEGNYANSALFFFHEIFHVLEWAYYKSPFPSAEHSFMRRNAWPADYQGNHEGFYNRKMQGK